MYILNYFLLFFDIAFLLGSIFELNFEYLIISLIILIYLSLNIYSINKLFKNQSEIEITYFNLIKKLSNHFKNKNYNELYSTLRELRKTNWYKRMDREYSPDLYKNMNQFHDIDEYKIEEFEK